MVAEWEVPERHGGSRTTLVVVDVASGERRTLLDDPAADFGAPTISPDGTRVACVRETRSTATAPIDRTLLVVPLAGRRPAGRSPRAGTAGPRSSAGWATRSTSPPTTRAVAPCSA